MSTQLFTKEDKCCSNIDLENFLILISSDVACGDWLMQQKDNIQRVLKHQFEASLKNSKTSSLDSFFVFSNSSLSLHHNGLL
jgi:hypothetical protein